MKQIPQDDSRILKENARLKAELELLKRQSQNASSLSRELVESEARYRNLVELAVDAIIMGDPQGNIIGANQSAVTLTGYPLEELLGQNLNILFSKEEHARIPLRYDLLRAGRIIQNERILTRKDGRSVPIGMNSRMMPDGSYHTFLRDHTELKANEERMHSLIRDLEAFAGTVSHDLRTLLTRILTASEILEPACLEALGDEDLKVFHIIQASAREMFSLVTNLITLTRAGRVEKPEEPVEAERVLQSVLDTLASELESKRITIETSPLPSLKVPETFISQIFQNLIGNAIKYGCRPGETIEIGGDRRDGEVRIWVRDHGPGLSPEDCERVFEVFYQGKNSTARTGTGLGLAIVDKIARAYGGQATVSQTPGGGCTFSVLMIA